MKLLRKPAPSLVQLASGEAIAVAPLASKERTPEVVLNFTRDTLTLLLTWTGIVPGEFGADGDKVVDPGVTIPGPDDRGSMKISTAAYHGGFALSEDFRKEFLQELGQLMPKSIFNGKSQVVFVPIEFGSPVQVEPGVWSVNVVANLMVFNQNNVLGKPIAFNKQIIVKAVDAPQFDANASGLPLLIQNIRASGLEINLIRDLNEGGVQ
ncbi:hypothetical protein IQ268_16775 [Oculatella sp. LEGE 06141]|uniref:hypothetical protein n=1 Tax=Oculatella sp. LEGE 06141 TaxID=1828648 RepID=UPI0018815479|nr:hypothetical protein [Oculatella sp. LEGE 06141]MBE9180219.1 hypothetical protein [Oculatella sp. LEGE 06141]